MFMSGGSRGIGLAIAARAARDGVKVALMAKTAEPHPKLPGTIYSAAEEIVEGIRQYIDLGFDELILHAPGEDQSRFLEQFGEDVLPLLRG